MTLEHIINRERNNAEPNFWKMFTNFTVEYFQYLYRKQLKQISRGLSPQKLAKIQSW